jgi:opacity protein-like surface antigen
MKSFIINICLFATPVVIFAQPVSLGVKGGIPITDPLKGQTGFLSGSPGLLPTEPGEVTYTSNTKRYLVGPTAEFHLPLGFSFEVDALYRRLDYQSSETGDNFQTTKQTTANSWQFPFLLKWRLPLGPVHPFVDAGPSVEYVSGIHRSARQTVYNASSPGTAANATTNNPDELDNQTRVGFTAGGGLEFKAGLLRISPEVRYTRWNTNIFRTPVRNLLSSNFNQADFLLGITF